MRTAEEIRADLLAKREREKANRNMVALHETAQKYVLYFYLLGETPRAVAEKANVSLEYLKTMAKELDLPVASSEFEPASSPLHPGILQPSLEFSVPVPEPQSPPPKSFKKRKPEGAQRFGADRWSKNLKLAASSDSESDNDVAVDLQPSKDEKLDKSSPRLAKLLTQQSTNTNQNSRTPEQNLLVTLRRKLADIETQLLTVHKKMQEVDMTFLQKRIDRLESELTASRAALKQNQSNLATYRSKLQVLHRARDVVEAKIKLHIAEGGDAVSDKEASPARDSARDSMPIGSPASDTKRSGELSNAASRSPEATIVLEGTQDRPVGHKGLNAGVRPPEYMYESPLSILHSHRFSPLHLADPSRSYSPMYNGVFVHDIENRFMCPAEVSGEVCSNQICMHLHAREFECTQKAIDMMIRTHIGSPAVFAENMIRIIQETVAKHGQDPRELSRAVLKYRHEVSPHQFLDWACWNRQS